ncbi:hypothetical protein BC567DRAFT_223696 [Phyllosticta citribraziliensis]
MALWCFPPFLFPLQIRLSSSMHSERAGLAQNTAADGRTDGVRALSRSTWRFLFLPFFLPSQIKSDRLHSECGAVRTRTDVRGW